MLYSALQIKEKIKETAISSPWSPYCPETIVLTRTNHIYTNKFPYKHVTQISNKCSL